MKQLQIFSMCLFFAILGLSKATAQVLNTVYPQEFTEYALKNPLKGFRPGVEKVGNRNYPTTIVHDYIYWNEIENDSTDGVQKIIDYCNYNWKTCATNNVKVIPRIVIQWDGTTPQGNWPSDLTAGDWTSQKFKDRIVKLIYKLGKAWDNDPRVAWVQTGIIGYWGEQEQPVDVKQDGWTLRLGDAYTNAFKNKKLVVRNQSPWEKDGYELGVYWDSFAHPRQFPNVGNAILSRNNDGRYLSQVIEGETRYPLGDEVDEIWVEKFGKNATLTLNSETYTNNMIDAIKQLHCTGLGWISGYLLNGDQGTDVATVKANASRMQNAFGYHFVIPEFSCSARVNQGSTLALNFKVKNTGSAPFYEHWPLVVTLIDETTHAIVWKKILTGIDVNKWLPGDQYDLTTRSYTIPAEEYAINASIQVPPEIPSGQYMIGLSILEPNSQTPGVFFGVKNFLAASQTQPLCRVGIGQNLVGGFTVNPNIFGSPVADDKRFYSLTPTGTMFKLITSTSIGGSVDLVQGDYLQETTVTVTAKPELGYQFTGWSGDASGTQNPLTTVMTSNKNITANFSLLPLPGVDFATNCGGPDYTAADGTVFAADQNFSGGNPAIPSGAAISGTTDDALYQRQRVSASGFSYNVNVPKGIYEVTLLFAENNVRAVGEKVFNVAIEGSTVSSNLDVFALVGRNAAYQQKHQITVIDGTLNILFTVVTGKANVAGIKVKFISGTTLYKLTRTAVNGYINSNPSVGTQIYSADTNLTLTAIPLPGFGFTGWSGSLSGSVNPIVINMNENKNVTAIFDPLPRYFLNINSGNGTVIKNKSQDTYLQGTPVEITAVPNVGYKFASWSGDVTSTTNPLKIVMNSTKNLTAIFEFIGIKTLSASSLGNGVVITNPTGTDQTLNNIVTITAKPSISYKFINWSGDLISQDIVNTVKMDADKVVRARFDKTNDFAVNYNGDQYIAADGTVYAQTSVSGVTTSRAITNTNDQFLYQSEKAGGTFSLDYTVDNGRYEVVLKFAEIYQDGAGKRIFNVAIERNAVLTNFDIFAEAGGRYKALDKTFQTIVSDGKLTIDFTTVTDNAKISAIQITRIPDITPTFTAVPQSCYGETLTPLPTTSNNGITGTWSPALNNLATTTYTFTPTAGQFATSTTLTLVIGGSTTWNNNAWTNGAPNVNTKAIIAGNYSQAVNLTACSLEVTGTAVVVVPIGFNFTISGKVTVASTASFTLENNTNLIQVGNIQNAGNITLKRNSAPLMRLDYTLWSSPVTNASQFLTSFSSLTATNRFYTYNASTNVYNEVVSPSSTPFNRGTGYLIRMPNTHAATPLVWSGSFTGVPNNGTIAIAVANNTFNAIGNPYPSSISANAFIDANVLTEPLYFWRKTNNAAHTSYATYTKAGGTSNSGGLSSIVPNGIIQVGQGFIAKSTSSTIAFNNSMRTANNDNQFLKTKEIERHRIWLNLSKESEPVNQMMVAYIAGATAAIDLAIDGRYFGDSPIALNSSIGNQEFVIQARGLPFENTDAIPLIFKTNADGNYTISIDHVDGLFSGNQDIFLKDNLIGVTQNLKEKAYSFTSSIGTFNTRFELVYKSNITLGTDLKEFNSDKIIVYKENGTLKINAGKTIMKNVHLYDIQGRLLFKQENINQNITKLEGFKAINQTILVKITSFEGKVIAEKVIFGEVK